MQGSLLSPLQSDCQDHTQPDKVTQNSGHKGMDRDSQSWYRVRERQRHKIKLELKFRNLQSSKELVIKY